MPLSAADRLGRYEILAPIGAGGMGEVYRARDTELERDVAVKVLPEAVSQNLDRLARFELEAKAVAKLSHPNILEIFDFGREGDITYAVIELLEGHTLGETLAGRPISWRKAVEIGAQIADGLAAAHEKSVIHRDIKPSNVFLCTDGRVKVLDFGLASDQGAVDFEAETRSMEQPLTREGRVLGTVGYMSPEQARGHRADHRSDIFALGCVLYEMVSGARPFDRGSSADTLAAILKEDPPPLSESTAEIAPEVSRTIERCLEKEPGHRFQSASDLAYNLRTLSSALTAPHVKPAGPQGGRRTRIARVGISVAVAAVVVAALAMAVWLVRNNTVTGGADLDPNKVVISVFENRTGDSSLDGLGILFSEALSERASGIGDFRVIPSPASFGRIAVGNESRFGSNTSEDLTAATGAGRIVSGSFYLVGDGIRVQATLIESTTGEVILSAPAINGRRDSADDLVEDVRQRVLGALAWSYHDDLFHLKTPPLLAAFLEYRRGQEILGTDWEAEASFYRNSIQKDPDFFTARIALYGALADGRFCDQAAQILNGLEPLLTRFTPYERLIVKTKQAEMEGRLTDALLAGRERNALSKGKDKYGVGLRELWLNRPSAAIEALRGIPYPTDKSTADHGAWATWWLARAHHMLGEYENELQTADQNLDRFSSDFILRGRKVAALSALGRLEEVDGVIAETALTQTESMVVFVMLDAASEMRSHGYREAATTLADRAVNWFNEQPDRQEGWLKPVFADALIHAGRFPEAKEVADDLLPTPPSATLLARETEESNLVPEEGGRSSGGFWWGDGGLVVNLGRVGTLAARLGDRDQANLVADRLRDFDSSCPAGNRTYQRACIACQLGDLGGALRLLEQAFSQGYTGIWGVHADVNLEPLWDYPPFQELIRPKG